MPRKTAARSSPATTAISKRRTAASAKEAAPAAAKADSAKRSGPVKEPTSPASAARAASAKVGAGTATQINFRADAETKAALDELTAGGTAVSEVIRKAIQDARRAARRDRAVAELEAIMADPEQRRISHEVYREMSNLSAW